jgi:hypothetical protein
LSERVGAAGVKANTSREPAQLYALGSVTPFTQSGVAIEIDDV